MIEKIKFKIHWWYLKNIYLKIVYLMFYLFQNKSWREAKKDAHHKLFDLMVPINYQYLTNDKTYFTLARSNSFRDSKFVCLIENEDKSLQKKYIVSSFKELPDLVRDNFYSLFNKDFERMKNNIK